MMRHFSVLAGLVFLCGCTSLAAVKQRDTVPVTVSEIQQSISCELHYAMQGSTGGGLEELKTWGAIVELTLSVKDKSNVVPGIGTLRAQVGDGTLTASPTTLTLDNDVEEKNTLAYFVRFESLRSPAECPRQGSAHASTGLELADLLIGVNNVVNSGGSITSATTAVAGMIATNGTVIGPNTFLPGILSVPERIPTVRYERIFTISRKIGGGLTFQVPEVTLSLTGTGAERARTANKITVTMGTLQPAAGANAGASNVLEESIWKQREEELQLLRDFTPSGVIIINPPPPTP